jgi:dephospho-CoA kinase
MARVLGLLGGIGSGKTAVASLFAEQGALVIDADALVSALHATPEVQAAIRERWGDGMFRVDGELDRARMADAVFDRPEELAELNAILHPKVIERVRRLVSECPAELCVIDAPLLMECGLDSLCDATVFVECEPSMRRHRVVAARAWSPEEIIRRERKQIPLVEKCERADYVVNNSGDMAATRKQVQRIFQQVTRNGEE